MQEGACCEISNARIAGGRIGIGCTSQSSARIFSCQMSNVDFGVSDMFNQSGIIIMEGNTISAKRYFDSSVHC